MHNATVEENTNGTGRVRDLTLEQVRKLDAAYNFVPGRSAVPGLPADSYPLRGVLTKGRAVRHVPLVPKAAHALARLKQCGDFTAGGELVFCNWRGRPPDKSALVARFKRARDAAGLRPLRFHDLRHTYGSLLARAGVDVLSIKSAMGHADLATTQRYLHARQAYEQVERFARAFEG